MNKTEERAKDTRPVLIVIENGILIHVGDPLHFHEETLIGYARSGKTIMTITNDDFKQNYKLYGPVPIAGAIEAQDDWKRVEDGLPEEDRVVQVYDACLYWLNHISQGYVKNGNWIIKYDCPYEAGDYISYYVTHWRNLPSPPSNDKP